MDRKSGPSSEAGSARPYYWMQSKEKFAWDASPQFSQHPAWPDMWRWLAQSGGGGA